MIRRMGFDAALAGLYVLWSGNRTGLGLLVGLTLGFVVVSIYDLATAHPNHGHRALRMLRFGAYFLTILVRANLQIAREIMTPGFSQTPRILRYPVDDIDDVQTTVLANCITLTPGTLVVDVSDDDRWLYVHCMYARDRSEAIAGLRRLDERLRREVFSW